MSASGKKRFNPRPGGKPGGKRRFEKPAPAGNSKDIKKDKKRNKPGKLVITFDEEERASFVGGFHKRKVERREYAQEMTKRSEHAAKLEERRVRREQKQLEQEQIEQRLRDRLAGKTPRPAGAPEVAEVQQGDDEEEEEEVVNSKLALSKRGRGGGAKKERKKEKRVKTETIQDGENLVTVEIAGMEDYDSA
jgi:hypothetical protein